MGKSTISMAMFNSYVKLPEGKFHQFTPGYAKFIQVVYQSSGGSRPNQPTDFIDSGLTWTIIYIDLRKERSLPSACCNKLTVTD